MAWPPTENSANTYYRRGTTIATLGWGTDDLYSGVIVKSMKTSEMVEEIKIENGTGLTAVLVGLKDGDQAEITCEDDRAVTWPSFMGIVTLLSPRATGGTVSTSFQVISNDHNAARKQNAERTLLCKKYVLITPANTGA